MDNNYYRSEKDLRGNLMTTNMMVIAEFVLGYALTILLIAFGIWVYGKIELRSLPWALAYLILGIVYSIIFYSLIQPQFSSGHTSHPPISPIKHFHTFIVANAAWEYVSQLLLGILLLADCTVLITKAGGNLTGKFAQMWRWIYDKSTFIGCALIASILFRIIWSIWLWGIF
jgi:hypothetical protein